MDERKINNNNPSWNKRECVNEMHPFKGYQVRTVYDY